MQKTTNDVSGLSKERYTFGMVSCPLPKPDKNRSHQMLDGFPSRDKRQGIGYFLRFVREIAIVHETFIHPTCVLNVQAV
jgi:hypothetical protein